MYHYYLYVIILYIIVRVIVWISCSSAFFVLQRVRHPAVALSPLFIIITMIIFGLKSLIHYRRWSEWSTTSWWRRWLMNSLIFSPVVRQIYRSRRRLLQPWPWVDEFIEWDRFECPQAFLLRYLVRLQSTTSILHTIILQVYRVGRLRANGIWS